MKIKATIEIEGDFTVDDKTMTYDIIKKMVDVKDDEEYMLDRLKEYIECAVANWCECNTHTVYIKGVPYHVYPEMSHDDTKLTVEEN